MKLKRLNLKKSSAVQLNESEMKMVIGGQSVAQDDMCKKDACHGVCYVSIYQGNCEWVYENNVYDCKCKI